MGYVYIDIKEEVTKSKIIGAVCDNCENDLDFNEDYRCVFESLEIALGGGYGMFFDDNREPRLLFCQECANTLCRDWPAFRRAIIGVELWHPVNTDEFDESLT